MTAPTSTPRWGALTVDCSDAERMAEFWAAMLGTSVRARWEQYVSLHPLVTGGPVIVFQRVDDKLDGRNTVHLDLHVEGMDEMDEAVKRAQALGARVVDHVHQAGAQWVVLQDPEGNVFCVVPE
jgi:catechol-2,3-dioxygenase